MGRVYKLSASRPTSEAAGIWLSKLDRGLEPRERDELRAWLAEDPSHETVFLAMAKTWDEMGALEVLADLFPDAAKQRVATRLPGVAAAASVVLAVCVLAWAAVSYLPSEGPEPAAQQVAEPSDLVYETGIGEQSTTILADGSTIVMNTNSLLHVRYAAHHRVLELVRGQVHVEVAPDKRRPLSVLAGDSIVQAVGTAFGVQLMEGNRAELVVTEGEVLVGTSRRKSRLDSVAATIAPVLPRTSLRVEQGEELLLGTPAATVKAVSPEDIVVKMSWREGNLMFRGEKLADALKEVERYTTVRFVFVDPDLSGQMVTGRYKAGDVDAFLSALGESHNISYTRTDDGQVLLSQL